MNSSEQSSVITESSCYDCLIKQWSTFQREAISNDLSMGTVFEPYNADANLTFMPFGEGHYIRFINKQSLTRSGTKYMFSTWNNIASRQMQTCSNIFRLTHYMSRRIRPEWANWTLRG